MKDQTLINLAYRLHGLVEAHRQAVQELSSARADLPAEARLNESAEDARISQQFAQTVRDALGLVGDHKRHADNVDEMRRHLPEFFSDHDNVLVRELIRWLRA